jgi:hypothetical protein
MALAPNTATAVSTTFKFATSIDTTLVGGGPGTPLKVTYTLDSELADDPFRGTLDGDGVDATSSTAI